MTLDFNNLSDDEDFEELRVEQEKALEEDVVTLVRMGWSEVEARSARRRGRDLDEAIDMLASRDETPSG